MPFLPAQWAHHQLELLPTEQNNQLYLYSASDVIGALDVLKLGVNGTVCNFPYMRFGGWKVPVYYYSLPAAADNWWTICLCRALSCANGSTYKTQLIFSDGAYWRPLEEPSTYLSGSA
ncbi:hypothetical protein EB241_10145 [Erwinia psidii]|uniref:Uncharacterized protein n=1 Tax=Erwinia psidii TaxID=69224 RepID=A0A3N6UQ80_9GAMM|nr:hypothetical protein EB241_10145 [Erwinia psidii]